MGFNGTEDNLIWKEGSENAGGRDKSAIVLPENVCVKMILLRSAAVI